MSRCRTEPLKTVEIHTSCSAPLILGEQIGGAQLVGFLGENGTGDTFDDSGDPTVVATGSGTEFRFIPTELGTYTVSFTVTDDDGGIGSASVEVQVGRTLVAPDPMNPSGTALFISGSDANGDLIVAATRASGIYRVNLNDGAFSEISRGGGLFRPTDIAIDANGDLIVSGPCLPPKSARGVVN